jgi:hypothetical protein
VSPAEPTPLPRCADLARDREDPLIGTAPPALRWLLVEHPGPWNLTAMVSEPLDGSVSQALRQACAAHHARPLLIRRHGRQPVHRYRRWGVVDSLTARSLWGTWAEAEDLRGAIPALASRSEAWARTPPMLLVCTHATHDVCCAIRGRPVAAALSDRWPSATWECSHLGGDRFAANVVVLPEGVVYGNLDEVSSLEVVGAHFAGRVTTSHLRGVSVYSSPMQAAVGHVMEKLGNASLRDVRVHGLTPVGDDAWRAEVLVDGSEPSRQRLLVTRGWRPAARLTCRAALPTDAAEYTVTEDS